MSFPGNDYATVRYTNTQVAYPGEVSLGSGTGVRDITDAANPVVGQSICHVGPACRTPQPPSTAWTPGPQGRMVVDLGSRLRVHDIRTDWTSGHVPALRVEFSSDGLGYTPAGKLTGHGRTRRLTTDTTTRYVALTTDTGEGGSARLIHLSLL